MSLKLWKRAEEDLNSKLLDLQTDSPQSFLERTRTHQLLSILKDATFGLFCELFLFTVLKGEIG